MTELFCRFKYPDGMTHLCLCHSRLGERFFVINRCYFFEYDSPIPKEAFYDGPPSAPELIRTYEDYEAPELPRVPMQLSFDLRPPRMKKGEYIPYRRKRPHRRARYAWLLRLRGLTYRKIGKKLGCNHERARQLVYVYSGYLNYRMHVRHVKFYFIAPPSS